jgi:hypothetical protein
MNMQQLWRIEGKGKPATGDRTRNKGCNHEGSNLSFGSCGVLLIIVIFMLYNILLKVRLAPN